MPICIILPEYAQKNLTLIQYANKAISTAIFIWIDAHESIQTSYSLKTRIIIVLCSNENITECFCENTVKYEFTSVWSSQWVHMWTRTK